MFASGHGEACTRRGFNVTMCDGSVQFISESIDIFLFGTMSTIANGEIIAQQ